MEWNEVHDKLVALANDRARLDAEEAVWLLEGLRQSVHVPLGMGTYFEYLERVFGYRPRFAAERLRVAQALEDLAEMRQALRDGVLCWSAVRELTRVATGETEGEWIEAATNQTMRQVEQAVSGLVPGDRPGDPGDEGVRRHVLRYEVTGETCSLMREAKAYIEREVGHLLGDDDVLAMIARTVLQGPSDEGRANYQIAMTVCRVCERGWQDGAGDVVEVAPEVIEAAECDAQRMSMTHVGKATQTIPPATRRMVLRRDHGRCVVPGCRSSRFLDVHHVRPRADGGNHDPDNLVCLCGAHHAAIHTGRLVVEGSATVLRFLRADGEAYGMTGSPAAVQAFAEAYEGLVSLGFGQTQSRNAVDKVRTHVGPDAGMEQVLRAALSALPGGRLAA